MAAAVIGAVLAVGLRDGAVPAAAGGPQAATSAVPGELIVRLADGNARLPHAALAAGASVRRYWVNGRYATVSVPPGREPDYARLVADLPGVDYAEPNHAYHPSFVPDDEYYGQQWHLPMIQMEEAWETTRGEGVTVAVLDTGVAFEEYLSFGQAPDLAAAEFVAPRDVQNGDEHPNDDNGHGTHVAGTIAQTTDNGDGAAGIASAATIMPVKVCVFVFCGEDAIAEGIFWAVDHGADVINMSLGGSTITQSQRDAIEYAEESGVVLVAAAGNGGYDHVGDPSLDYPAAIDTIISVGAVRYDGTRSPYSNYGYGEGGTTLDLVAPGGDLHVDQNNDGVPDGVVQNTYAYACGTGPVGFSEFDYCPMNGTSMASPHVAGVAALVLSAFPGLTSEEVRELLKCSALDLGDPGEDLEYGAGLVQAADALRDSDADGTPDCLDETPDPPPELGVSIESATVAPDEVASVSLSASAPEPGIGAYTVDILYDPDVAVPVGCAPHPSALCNLGYGPGTVRVAGYDLEGLAGSTTLAEISFQAVGGAGSHTGLDLSLVDFADPVMTSLLPDAEVMNGGIDVEDVPGFAPGDVDCDGDTDSVDGLFILRETAGLPPADCIAGGDVDCDGDVDSVDALMVMRHVAGLSVNLPPGCPPIDSEP